MSSKKVLVSGSDGRIGRATVEELHAHGYAVTPADLNPRQPWGTQVIDFQDLGQVIGVMQGQDAVIHLAAIPSPDYHTADVVFRTNVLSTFNVLEAATILGVKNITLASSISALGYAFRHRPFNPHYLPIDEAHPLLSQDCYGLSKMIGEELAEGFLRRAPDMSLVSLRFTAVFDEAARAWLPAARQAPTNDASTYGAFWTFVDVRDAAAVCRLALEYDAAGHEAFYICAPTIYREDDIRALMAKHFPGDYPIAEALRGSASPVDASKAERTLGWKARYDWDGAPLT
ncbi:MAG: NAD(P)-dependent oxidoreductase [Chloroflexota bacterium]|nr:NAD(P)-dependent oxidoreductase [Chloroflexota bacterium]